MTLPKRILVVVDPTADPQPALQHAAVLARKTQAQLELFVCAYDADLLESRFVDAAMRAKARAALLEGHLHRLRLLAKPLATEGLEVAVDAVWDSPLCDGIVRKAIQAEADLVVKDTHYHSVLKRSIFSNTDWHLIRQCPAPLWLVKPRAIAARPCVVAAVDPLHDRDKPAELDHQILGTAEELAEALGGEAHAFHAFDVATVLTVSADAMSTPIALPVLELVDALRETHTQALRTLIKAHAFPRERVHMHEGGTRAGLVALTDQLRADVVVMGAVSRRGFARIFIGNTAEDVLDKLGCDLLIVKPPALVESLRRNHSSRDTDTQRMARAVY